MCVFVLGECFCVMALNLIRTYKMYPVIQPNPKAAGSKFRGKSSKHQQALSG